MNQRRDTIVIGASAGGVFALRDLLARLPSDLPAAILVVQHQAPVSGYLRNVLAAATTLPVIAVETEQTLRPSRVYIATPDTRLADTGDQVIAARGPRENRAGASINVLFRTAAAVAHPGIQARSVEPADAWATMGSTFIAAHSGDRGQCRCRGDVASNAGP